MPSLVDSPSDLARAFFGHDHWSRGAEILDAVFRPRARVAAKACHASSKTFSAADAVVLQLLRGGDALTTAPTWEQVRTVLWGSIHRALYDAERRGVSLAGWDINQTEIKTPAGAHALGLSTNEGVRFQGWHARPDSSLLIVFDEAPGVMPDIYEAVQGISAGGDVRWLLIGNPVIASGPFYDLFATDAPGWARFTIDAFDTPNLRGLDLPGLLALDEAALDRSERPYLVTRRWVRDRYAEWGADHPLWQSRVRGQFPLQSDDALLSLAWLERARARLAAFTPSGPAPVAGLDVAGPGEAETVLVVCQDGAIVDQHAWAQADPRGEIIAALAPWRHQRLARLNIDTAGVGHYLARHLEDEGLPVNDVNVGAAADDPERFANLKAELYWSLRERFAAGAITGLTDQTMLAQLASILYAHNARGRVVIEPKEQARKRGVKSPDRAEALMLACAPPGRAQLAGRAFERQAGSAQNRVAARSAPSLGRRR